MQMSQKTMSLSLKYGKIRVEFILSSFQSMLTPLTQALFDWGELENSYVYLAAGIEVSTIKSLIWVAPNHKLRCFSSHLILQLSLPNPLKPGVKSRMKM